MCIHIPRRERKIKEQVHPTDPVNTRQWLMVDLNSFFLYIYLALNVEYNYMSLNGLARLVRPFLSIC